MYTLLNLAPAAPAAVTTDYRRGVVFLSRLRSYTSRRLSCQRKIDTWLFRSREINARSNNNRSNGTDSGFYSFSFWSSSTPGGKRTQVYCPVFPPKQLLGVGKRSTCCQDILASLFYSTCQDSLARKRGANVLVEFMCSCCVQHSKVLTTASMHPQKLFPVKGNI